MTVKKFDFKKHYKDLSKIESKSEKLFIKSRDSNVCWRIWGKGNPIIFLHGGYGSWAHWIKQALPFSKIIRYSFRICLGLVNLMI